MLAGIFASAALSGVYALGGAGWALGFVAFVPWLRTLDASRSIAGALLGAAVMSIAFTAAVFFWFGTAIGQYTHLGTGTGLLVLLLAAPLLQPQFLAYALVRHVVGRSHGPVLRALAAAAAWVAMERLVPKLLGDTLGHGLYPSLHLRQAADVVGVAGLTALLLLANECAAAAWARRAEGMRAVVAPLALAALVPLVLAGYGLAVLLQAPAVPDGKPLRLGGVQSNIVDYERLRQEKGAAAVVREVLDTHYWMSRDAVERRQVDAVLWSETVYPTTFGSPKSESGAELDREILSTIDATGVPFVFGTFDRDAAGEYNAAAFVVPGSGLLGFYRKTRLFPLTEYVPAWLDSPALRRWLPWAGTWRPGTGARVFPLRLADGREIPVLPLICLDDMDAGLAIDGARLGAQAILTMSNDSWFSAGAQGARLHLAAAAFRSIETRLPQFRVTTDGYSAAIDANGTVTAGTRRGERTLAIGELAVREPRMTLMVACGDWVGLAGAAFLVLLAATAASRKRGERGSRDAAAPGVATAWPAEVAVLSPVARLAAGLLRAFARGSLLWMGAALLLGSDPLRTNTLAQIRAFAALFLAPEAAAWCVLQAFAARASIENGALVLARGARRLELALRDVVAVEPWRVPVPSAGASLRLASGELWHFGIARVDAAAMARAIAAAGAPMQEGARAAASPYAQARAVVRRGRLDHPLAKFVLFPFVLAIPAFRLHQQIAYGGPFGEYYTFGATAYLVSFALWFAAWAIGVMLFAAWLRAGLEAAALTAALLRPGLAMQTRRRLERLGLATFYLGLPAALALLAFGG
ncbi:MAG: apolipoprotein N-acyltransferase [Caldimonas sp.]